MIFHELNVRIKYKKWKELFIEIRHSFTIILIIILSFTIVFASDSSYPLIKEGEKVQIKLSSDNSIFRIEPESNGGYNFELHPSFEVTVEEESELDDIQGYPIMAIFADEKRLNSLTPIYKNFGDSDYFRHDRYTSESELGQNQFHIYSSFYQNDMLKRTYYIMIGPRVADDEGMIVEFIYYSDNKPTYIGVKIFVWLIIFLILLAILLALNSRKKKINLVPN